MSTSTLPSTPGASSPSTFGKLFSKLRTPTTPSDRDANKSYSTPTAKGSLRHQAAVTASTSTLSLSSSLAHASSTSLALPASPADSSGWDIEMPKFETGDWLGLGGPQPGASPYGNGGAMAAGRASTSTFASSAASLGSYIAGEPDSTIQQAPTTSTLSFKSLGMGSLSRARGKDLESATAASSSGGDSSGDRNRKPSFLSRSATAAASADQNATATSKPYPRSWTQKGKDLLNRSGGAASHPHEAEASSSRVSDDFKSPTASLPYSSLSSRTSSDSITPAARLSTLRRPFPTSTAGASGRPRRAQRVPRMLHSNPSAPEPLPTSNPSTTPALSSAALHHRPASSVEIRGALRAEQLAGPSTVGRQSLDERRRAPLAASASLDGDMMQPYRHSEDPAEPSRAGLQRKPSETLMTLGRRASVSLLAGQSSRTTATAPLRRTDSSSTRELETRPGSSTAMYNDPPPPSRHPQPQQHQQQQPQQDENEPIRRPGSAMGGQQVPFPRHEQARPVLGETYRATNAPPLRQARTATKPEEYLVPVRDRSPGVAEVTPSLTHKQAYVGASYQQQQQQQLQMQQQQQQQQQQYAAPLPAPEGPLPPKPTKKPVIIVVNGKRYNRIGLLGKGGSSRVYRVIDEHNNLLALKRVEISRNDKETRASFVNEIHLLEKLRGNPQIIRLVDSEMKEEKSKDYLLMVMEQGEVDLATLLQEKATKPVSLNFVRYIWEQMLEAVQVIHDENVVHTDLKPANFVLVKGRLKLIDFGISKAIANDTTNIGRDQQIGTANYMPPEALMDSGMGQDGQRLMKLGRAADVWALGCILYQMTYRKTPYAHIRDITQKIMAIQNPNFTISYPTTSYPSDDRGEDRKDLGVPIGPDLIKGMQACLVFDKAKRATIPELLDGAFLRRDGAQKEDTIDEGDLAVIVKRVAKMVAGKKVSNEEADMLANKLMLELRQARQ
ncbi:hypothetical protein RQP46_000060 [Phenoliferia psychrophenolica]